MFYFNLFNNVVPQSGSAYLPIPMNNLALYDITKPDISVSVTDYPYKEYDKKNIHAAHNIIAHDYVITKFSTEGPGRVNFAAGNKIILGDGFKVTNGGYFHGYIDPTIQAMACSEPGNTNCEGVFKTSGDIMEEDTIDSDTIICSLDSIQIFYENDTTGGYGYYWDFGNGVTSNLPEPFIYYSSVGSYDITLILTDSVGNTDTILQNIIISECPDEQISSTARKGNFKQPEEEDFKSKNILSNLLSIGQITITPNPNSGKFTVTSNQHPISSITVTNVLGEVVYTSPRPAGHPSPIGEGTGGEVIDISRQPQGIYFVQVRSENVFEVRKIIFQ